MIYSIVTIDNISEYFRKYVIHWENITKQLLCGKSLPVKNIVVIFFGRKKLCGEKVYISLGRVQLF